MSMQRQFTGGGGGGGCQARNLDAMSRQKMIYESGSVLPLCPGRDPGGVDTQALAAAAAAGPRPLKWVQVSETHLSPPWLLPCCLKQRAYSPKTHLLLHKDALPFLLDPPPSLLTSSPFISFSPPPVTSLAQLLGPTGPPRVWGQWSGKWLLLESPL